MTMIEHYKSGFSRCRRAWKGILIIWILTLFLVSILALPLRAGINSVLGRSMVTELFNNGINIDVLTDFDKSLGTIISSFASGLSVVLLLGFIMNAFLSAGIFSLLRTGEKPSSSLFFAGGASNFLSFLIITFISSAIIILLIILFFGVPLIIISAAGSPQEGAVFKTGRILALLVVLIIPVFVLVADNSRAWQVSNARKAGFRSIGKGFSLTFSNFFFSYFFMVILLAVQILFGLLFFKILSGSHPVTGGGVFLLFIISQVLFIFKILLKTWRYGSISSLVESRLVKREKDMSKPNYEI